MSPIDEIARAQAATLVDEDGGAVFLELARGLSLEEIDGLEAEAGVALPRELRTLLEHTSGIDGSALETIDFTGRSLSVGAEELFPAGLPVAHDGYGNHWLLDLIPPEQEAAPVFFLCHDPPVVLYQSPNLAHFLRETFRMSVPPHESLVDDVHECRLLPLGRENPRVLERAAALAADDDLRAFAEELDERWTFVDLREPEVGMGFEWGAYGPRTELRRHGNARIFAFARPEQRPGLLSRLFGSPARNP